jgi:hypothetical protein
LNGNVWIHTIIFSESELEVNIEARTGLPRPEIIITAKVIESFQNLSYIGEMRQRWEEIKKLQVRAIATQYP